MIINKKARADFIRHWPPPALSEFQTELTSGDYGLVYSVFADLAISQAWEDIKLHPLEQPGRPLLSGINPAKGTQRIMIYPVSANSSTSIHELCNLFAKIQNAVDLETKAILLGIVHTDSTVVYYTLNEGIVKPTVN